ncbi:hypothetical protein U1Q18_004186 [Sarracenia purpurea var. burkii]
MTFSRGHFTDDLPFIFLLSLFFSSYCVDRSLYFFSEFVPSPSFSCCLWAHLWLFLRIIYHHLVVRRVVVVRLWTTRPHGEEYVPKTKDWKRPRKPKLEYEVSQQAKTAYNCLVPCAILVEYNVHIQSFMDNGLAQQFQACSW